MDPAALVENPLVDVAQRWRERAARDRALLEAIDEGFCIIEVLFDDAGEPRDYRFLETNPAFERQTGLVGAVGHTMRELAPTHEAHWFQIYGRVARTGVPERFEQSARALGRDYDVYAFRVGPAAEQRVAILFNDVTRRKRMEQALRESEERFRTVVNLVPDLLWQSESDGSATWFNDRWYAHTGQTPEEARGFGWTAALHPEDRDGWRAGWDEAVQAGRPAAGEQRLLGADGQHRWFVMRAEPLRDDGGRIVRWFGTATDVHEQRLALEDVERRVAERTDALAAANAQLQRAAAERNVLRRQLASAEEDERRRLARELHDEVAQHLAALGLGLQALSDVALPGSEIDRRAAQLRRLVGTMGQELHALAVRLRPRALDDFGLEVALEAYADEWSRQCGIPVDVHARLPAERSSNVVESAIYRIVQEALANVARHSGASRASVVVEQRGGQIVAIVEDDGRGFDAESVAEAAPGRPGLGLLGIRERVALLGGTVEIESDVDAGSSLFVRVPIDVRDDTSSERASAVRSGGDE